MSSLMKPHTRSTPPLLFELSTPGRVATRVPEPDVPSQPLPADDLLREPPVHASDQPGTAEPSSVDPAEPVLPEVSEQQLVRHFTQLSQLNFSIDTNFYPLGSCTMKYNPKMNERIASMPEFADLHPEVGTAHSQGALGLIYDLEHALSAITGFERVTLQPAAGAQGELTGVLMIRAYHHSRNDDKRRIMLIPDSAHGTNPATVTMAGMEPVEVPSDADGNADLDFIRRHCNDELAGLMITNPNTLGLFEQHIVELIDAVHEAGGLVYGDGANLNAILGALRPADVGIDVMHFNLHKTFSTPHGGGGPGAGPVGVRPLLVPFLPGPVVDRHPQEEIGRASCRERVSFTV